MSVLPVGFGSSGGIDVGDIGHSLRLRAAASAYFSRTPASAGNSKTWTFSVRGKRGTLGAGAQAILSAGPGSNTDFGIISFDYSGYADKICVIDYPGGGSVDLRSTRVCRDTSGHYHLVVTIDTTQATAADRVKIWWNNEQITAFDSATYPSLNADTRFNSTSMHYIGAGRYLATSSYYDGLLSDVHFVDGQALTPSSFGEQNADGVWVPKPYTGTYGANGFKLDFADAAVTSGSNAGLGKDTSGNGNYWNTNNISVTAGVTYDSMVDTPTNNYATLNPLDLVSGGTAYVTSGANLDITTAATYAARSTIWPTSGKVWAEYTMTSSGTANGTVLGVGRVDANIASGTGTYTTYRMNGNKEVNGTGSAYGATFTNTDVIGIAWDVSAGTIEFYKQTSGSGSFTSQGQLTGISTAGDVTLLCRTANSGSWNFGQRPFNNSSIPSGYVGLCTANLPAVAITNPKKHFNAKTRTGTAATFSVTGELFQPGMVWTKGRSGATDHAIYDAVRGVEKRLETNNTDAEVTGDTTGLTAFNSDGFTGGALAQINTNAATYVDWMWKANGAGASNTAGSITSSVSANQAAGFSVVTYTGTGANATVGHGLGIAPKFIIIKRKDTAGQDWGIGHAALDASTPWAYYINFTTGARAASSLAWQDTAPTSTVFSIGTGSSYNTNTGSYIAYCFAEVPGYSKFGSYVGNGSTDGPFVFCGFRPRFILVKRSDAGAENWLLWDSSRMTYNVSSLEIKANLANAEADVAAANGWDQTSNGFKLRSGNSIFNTSTATYIYAAFAEHPFGGSNCAPAPAR